MRIKYLFLLIACVCGAIAAVGASQVMQERTPEAARTTDIFVASRVIEPSEKITAGMMTLESWPAGKVPAGTTNDLAALEGKYATQRFFTGEPMMLAKLGDQTGGISAQIPSGFSVVAMRPDAASSVAGLLRPGDHVNVIGYFTKSDEVPETGVKTVLRNVQVFATGGRITAGTDAANPRSTPSTISLLIPQADEEAWMLASELGRLRLSLSAAADTADPAVAQSAGAEFLHWLRHRPEPVPPAPLVQEPAEITPVTTPIAPPPVLPPMAERPRGFKMLKLHGENWTEYEVPAGKLPVAVTGSSRHLPPPTFQADAPEDHESAAVAGPAASSPFRGSLSTTPPTDSILDID